MLKYELKIKIVPRKFDRLRFPNWYIPKLALLQTGTSANWHFPQQHTASGLNLPTAVTPSHFECYQFITDWNFQVKQLQKKNLGMERAMMDMKNEMAAERETFQREKEKWKIQMKKFQERYENERREFEKQRLLLQVL